MKINLVKNYISKLTKQDIINYLNKENIEANQIEIDLIYDTLLNNYNNIENIEFNSFIVNYKNKLNEKLYNKIIEKYNEYKKFIE
jgi:hypothetical protein